MVSWNIVEIVKSINVLLLIHLTPSPTHGICVAVSRITGRIPTQVGLFPKLEVFRINNNEHTENGEEMTIGGTVPGSMGFLTNLYELHLHGNDLRGNFPESVVTLQFMESLQIHDNRLRGDFLATQNCPAEFIADCNEPIRVSCGWTCCTKCWSKILGRFVSVPYNP